MRRPRILFVAMPDSVHTARWIRQLSDTGWDIHLFPSRLGDPHPLLAGVRIHEPALDRLRRLVRVEIRWPMHVRGVARLRAAVERLGRPFEPAARLARLVRRLKPDLVHSLEIQQAGCQTLDAKRRLGGAFPPWIVTNWGSDIFLFGRFPEHAARIREVLGACDIYDCECHRDVRLGREFGFHGPVWPVLPNAGGYDVERLKSLRAPGPASARRLIALKGYQGWAGRALVGLRAIELAADALKGYRVAVYSALTEDVHIAARLTALSTGIPIEIVPHQSHDDMMRLHGQARISIGLSISDSISTSLLEAMIMGSFPIQSGTGAADEWIRDGESGIIVHPDDPEATAAAIRRAAADDALVDRAADANGRTALDRLDARLIRLQAIEAYRQALAAREEKHGGH